MYTSRISKSRFHFTDRCTVWNYNEKFGVSNFFSRFDAQLFNCGIKYSHKNESTVITLSIMYLTRLKFWLTFKISGICWCWRDNFFFIIANILKLVLYSVFLKGGAGWNGNKIKERIINMKKFRFLCLFVIWHLVKIKWPHS